jgi:hypothetical protein
LGVLFFWIYVFFSSPGINLAARVFLYSLQISISRLFVANWYGHVAYTGLNLDYPPPIEEIPAYSFSHLAALQTTT